MSQIRTLEYTPAASTDPLSKVINRHFADVIQAGPKSGLLPKPGSAGKITIEAGCAMTREGVKITETTDKTDELTVTPNSSGNHRWDAIVQRHTYQTTIGGQDAPYEIIVGIPAATPTRPAIPSDGLALGYGYIEDGQSDYNRIEWTSRPVDDFRIVTVAGVGAGRTGDYCGNQGLLDCLEDLKDVGGVVLLYGLFDFTSPLAIPAGVRLVGATTMAVIFGSGAEVLRMMGRTGTGTLGTGKSTLTDATATFTNFSRQSLVFVDFGGGATKIYYIVSMTDTELTLQADSADFTGQSVTYWVMNTAQVENIDVVNTGTGNGIALGHTFAAIVRGCVVSAPGKRLTSSADQMHRGGAIVNNVFEGDSGYAIDVHETDGMVILDNVAFGQTIRIRIADSKALVRGNQGATTSYPDGDGVGDATYPFVQAHDPDGTHKTASITQDMLYERLKAFYTATSDQTIAAGSGGTPAETQLHFNTKKFDAPGDDRITTGTGWHFTADRAMTVRVSAVVAVEAWGADPGQTLEVLLKKTVGVLVSNYALIAREHTAWPTDDGASLSYVQAPTLTGSVLIQLNEGESFHLAAKNHSDATAAMLGQDGSLARSHISIEEV